MGLFDRLWPEAEPGDMLDPERPDVEVGDVVAFTFPSGLFVKAAQVTEADDVLDERWIKVKFGASDYAVTWLLQGSVELVEKAMLAA